MKKRWLVIGCYIPQGIAAETNHIVMAFIHFLNDVYPILVRNLNVYLSQTEGRESDKDFILVLVVESLKDMAVHFRPWW